MFEYFLLIFFEKLYLVLKRSFPRFFCWLLIFWYPPWPTPEIAQNGKVDFWGKIGIRFQIAGVENPHLFLILSPNITHFESISLSERRTILMHLIPVSLVTPHLIVSKVLIFQQQKTHFWIKFHRFALELLTQPHSGTQYHRISGATSLLFSA